MTTIGSSGKWIGFLLCILISGRAFADDVDARKTAGRLVEEGISAFEAKDYRAALARFRAAHNVYPSPKIFLNIARANVELGRLPDAAAAYSRFLAATRNEKGVSDDKREFAQRELLRLERDVVRLSLIVEPEDAAVVIDGSPLEREGGEPLFVEPGTHRVVVSAPSFISKEVPLTFSAGASERVVIRLEPYQEVPALTSVVATRGNPAGPSADNSRNGDAGKGKRIGGLALAAGGLAVAAVGGYFTYQSSVLADNVTDACAHGCRYDGAVRDDDEARKRAQVMAAVFYASGGALLVGGGILYYLGIRADAKSAQGMPTLNVAPQSAEIGYRFRFE